MPSRATRCFRDASAPPARRDMSLLLRLALSLSHAIRARRAFAITAPRATVSYLSLFADSDTPRLPPACSSSTRQQRLSAGGFSPPLIIMPLLRRFEHRWRVRHFPPFIRAPIFTPGATPAFREAFFAYLLPSSRCASAAFAARRLSPIADISLRRFAHTYVDAVCYYHITGLFTPISSAV